MSDKSRLENNNLTLQNITNTVMNMPDYVEIKNQDINVTENGLYTANTGYTGLGTVTVNVSSGEGDVKLFDSIANMQADPNPTEGDLAVVYRNELEGITEDSEFSSCIFPNTVVLDEAFTGNVSDRFRQVDDGYFDGIMNVSSTASIFQGYGESSEIRVEYTSQDGITYTRTDGGEELVEFGVTIKWESLFDSPFNSIIGNFMKIGGNYFEGLYQYSNNSYSLAKTQLMADKEKVYKDAFYGKNGVEIGSVQNVTNLSISQLQTRVNLYSDISNLSLNENVTSLYMIFRGYYNLVTVPNFDTSNVINIYGMFYECSDLTTVPKFNTINATNMGAMFSDCLKLTTVPNLDTSNVIDMGGMFQGCQNLTTVPNYNTSKVTSMSSMFFGCYNLTIVPNFDTSKVTDMNDMFPRCNALMSVPNFDTSKVTNMSGMFYACYNLTTVPQYNTSNVTSMYGMFENCNNLTTVPQYNTSNVTSMYGMFGNCYNLTTVPEFNTSNVTNMMRMFINCNNLSNDSYANIANSLPLAVNLPSNSRNISNIGLNIENFTLEQKQILGNKGYYDALQYVVNTSNLSASWNILYS